MHHDGDDSQEFEIPGELVERKRRECKKDHSKDKKKTDELVRQSRTNHKKRIEELEEDFDQEDDEYQYRHLWK